MVYFLFWFFVCFFLVKSAEDGRAISRRGCLYRLVEVVGVAARGILCIYIYIYIYSIYYTDIVRNTGGHMA